MTDTASDDVTIRPGDLVRTNYGRVTWRVTRTEYDWGGYAYVTSLKSGKEWGFPTYQLRKVSN